MTFSVVIPAYNAAETLAEAIESVLAQTCQDFEIVVVDDGSSDDTAAVAASFTDPRVRVYSQPNAGPSAARNLGIAHAAGEYVSSLDSDDLWLPDYLAEMGRALREHPQAQFAYTHAWILDERSGRFRETPTAAWHQPHTPLLEPEEFLVACLKRNCVNAATIHRDVFERVGGYDPSLSHGEDWELWLRIANAGVRAVHVAGPLTIFRDRPVSRSTEPAPMAAAPGAVFRKVLEHPPASPQVRAIVEARLSAIDRSNRRHMRAALAIRHAGGTLTRAFRRRYTRRLRLRSSPPAAVTAAFPHLGLGEPFSWTSRPPDGSSAEAVRRNGADAEMSRAEPHA